MTPQDQDSLSSNALDPRVALIFWNSNKKKYDLVTSTGKIIVSSKDKGYLNYLVVKQKHTAVVTAGVTSTIIAKDQHEVEPKEQVPSENLGISNFALGCVTAELQSSVESGIKPEFTRPRGRPRKYFPVVENKRTHTLGDEERDDLRSLLPVTLHKIKLDFREYLEEDLTPKKALENICELYNISYFQAFNICEKLM